MTQGVYIWSKTAATNASVDATINWAEGQSPSSVNDSARAEMARIAEWRDDISGTITTTGSGTAYAVTSNQNFDTLAHMSGAMICFIPHTTCGATVTLNVDGLGAKPLRTSPSIELLSGMLVQGTPYRATYVNADSAFYLQDFYVNPYNIPVGGMMPYLGSSAPNSNFALPFGQAISRSTFSVLFSLISTTFGIGDGSTTFNIPDLRGRAIFGLDNMGGSTASRITVAGGNFNGTTLGATGGAENHTLTTPEIPSHTHTQNSHNHTFPTQLVSNLILGAGNEICFIGGSSNAQTVASTTAVNQNTGGGGAHTILPPAMVLPFILRVI